MTRRNMNFTHLLRSPIPVKAKEETDYIAINEDDIHAIFWVVSDTLSSYCIAAS